MKKWKQNNIIKKNFQKLKSYAPTFSCDFSFSNVKNDNRYNSDDIYSHENKLDTYLRKIVYLGLGAIFVLIAIIS